MDLTLDPLVPTRDAALVHTWIDEQPTHHAWLARLDGEPVALFQDFLPTAEEVGDHYDVEPGDLGLHFMLAPAAKEQRGFTASVMTFLLASAFADPAVRRLVVDPDALDAKALALVQRLGFQLGPVAELSTKPAQLAFLGRDV